MTTGYLWTGQFEEVSCVVQGEGKPQSMELDENTLEGHWSTNVKNNIEFFIINDAIFSKLCILGDDVEPCFEGASISKPDISSTFSMTIDDNFKKTLFSMMKELSEALKGGNGMEQKENTSEVEVTFTEEEQNLSEPAVESTLENDLPTEAETTFSEDSQVEEEVVTEPEAEADFAKEKDEEEEKEDSTEEEEESKEEDEDDKEKYSLLEQQYNDLSTQFEQLKQDYDAIVASNTELLAFKEQVENEKKDALINEFYMLSDEDKKEVIENKSKYTLEDIKAKLSIICYDKKVNFNSDNSENFDSSKEEEIITYNYDDEDANLPEWVKAVKNNI